MPSKPIDRRTIVTAAVGAAIPAAVAPASAATSRPLSGFGLDAAQLGVHAGAPDDQSRALQKAIDQAASSRVPLLLGPGTYLAADLRLPSGAQLLGVRGASRLMLAHAGAVILGDHADDILISGLSFDGRKIGSNRALIDIAGCNNVRVRDCDLQHAGTHGVSFDDSSGEISSNTVVDAADTAIFSQNGRGLIIADNVVRGAGNGGIRVWRSEKGDDGAIIRNNRIEDTLARSGGSGENGNAINVFRAANVIVQGNRIRKAAFTAIRGNAASNIVIQGNVCGDLGEVAIYSEFDFEGAVIAGNVVDGAAVGVSVTNFDKGGRLALVQGNVVRNLDMRAQSSGGDTGGHGVGIDVEADTAVSGNVVENAATAGIAVGFGQFQRDVSVTGNIVRASGYGITVSVATGAGVAMINDNLITGARRGGIVGMEWKKPVTGDLAKDGTGAYEHLTLSNNRVR